MNVALDILALVVVVALVALIRMDARRRRQRDRWCMEPGCPISVLHREHDPVIRRLIRRDFYRG